MFGEQLKRARQARGLTQAELGAAMVPPTSLYAVSLWELNKRRPDVEQLATLCRILHVSADVLLERAPFQLGPMPDETLDERGPGDLVDEALERAGEVVVKPRR